MNIVRQLDLLTNFRNETKCSLDKYEFTTNLKTKNHRLGQVRCSNRVIFNHFRSYLICHIQPFRSYYSVKITSLKKKMMKREIKDNKFERKAKEKKMLERKKSKKEERKKNRKTKRNVTPFLFSLQHFIAPALYLMPCLQA